ncbi:cupin domain-containing protein [Nguyenibacter vanlangensis]|uniref:Cupin domain-containing protein n=1 Tax=Nguyenibacter vanlangensis TaxID=1216886 RepID=A0ABZ3D866_9PROT
MKIHAIVLIISSLACTNASAATQHQGWTPDAIPWQVTAPDGTRYAQLEGKSDKGRAPFSYAFSIPAGVWDAPHSHSATARVFVAKGILRIGYGSSFDHSRARSYPAGSYVIVPAGVVHFDGSDTDTIIIGTATGPWTTTYVDRSSPTSAGP